MELRCPNILSTYGRRRDFIESALAGYWKGQHSYRTSPFYSLLGYLLITSRTRIQLSHRGRRIYISTVIILRQTGGLGGLVVSALDFQAGYRGFESRSGQDNFQTIITPGSYSTCPGLSIKWTGWHLVTDSGTKCAWMIHESKAVQIHVHHSNRRCLYVPRVPGGVKNPHNNNK